MSPDVSNADVDAWVESRWGAIFEKEKFNALKKERQVFFQAVVFMNLASREISKAYTILKEIEGFENEGLKEINDALQKFIEKTRFAKETKK